MTPWYNNVTLRKEVREGRSFSPDEFAIALEQVVDHSAPEDYRDPVQFFSRTCFTRALKDHAGMVLRRLAGRSENTAPVVTLVTQFGGGKTHTLASLYHLATTGADAVQLPGVADLVEHARIPAIPNARVGVFVGNAWDPTDGRETPWVDVARQLAGDQGVSALGTTARTTPPGTAALGRVFAAADAPVLLLFDEVLNFVNRHRSMADGFYAFLQNLTVAVTGRTQAVAVISLPRSQVEMTDWDQEWQEKITKVVGRVARDLIANDEAEISEVVRRRLIDNLGSERVRKAVARGYADWCFERSARLPSEWLAVDSATTTAKAKQFLRERFEACYPFHPATLSVFQRKWRALPQFQQTRGALAMLAQWISCASREQFHSARTEPLITLGSAPLDVPEFRAVVLGQLGEARLDAAIEADLAGPMAHARALDADTMGALRDIHRRVGTAVLFESSGGQIDKVAHLPELRFALGEPNVETTTVDTTASTLEDAGFFVRKVGADGYRIHHQATLKKVVNDRRASLDEHADVKPAIRRMIEDEFKKGDKGDGLSLLFFPADSAAIQDSPRLTLAVLDPDDEWATGSPLADRVRDWTKEKGGSPRLYPAALVWCAKRPGRDLADKVELWLAWQAVARELAEGVLGAEFERTDRTRVRTLVREAQDAARDEVWATYRFIVLADPRSEEGLHVIDLGAGHASSGDSLRSRVISALKAEALLNAGVGAGYIARNWPPALKTTGAWPLAGLRQSFLDGSLTRLIDPDAILRQRIVDFVSEGEFGLASGGDPERGYVRLWYREPVSQDDVTFDADVFLVAKDKADELTTEPEAPSEPTKPSPNDPTHPDVPSTTAPSDTVDPQKATLRISGSIPPEVWNKLGISLLPKLRSGDSLDVHVDFTMRLGSGLADAKTVELKQVLTDLGIVDRLRVDRS